VNNARRIGGNQFNPNRSPTDLYPTAGGWTRALLGQVRLRGPLWEPAAGNGDMVRELERAGYQVQATDVLTGTDFLTSTVPWPGSIITNPPYRFAYEFIDRALALAAHQVAMLLPMGALGGSARCRRLWQPRPPTLILVIANRMVVHGKPSQFNHVWAVWDRRVRRPDTVIRWAITEEATE
jgi:hypothetical protein